VSTIVVLAKAPVAGRVKTRLCPPLTLTTAATVAAAALADTLDAVRGSTADRRVLVLCGAMPSLPPGFEVRPQRGAGLGQRLAAAFADCGPGPLLLIGMDTPQVTSGLLDSALQRLAGVEAVLGRTLDGGWWALGLRDVRHAAVLADVPMSTSETGALTQAALCRQGIAVASLPVRQDVDTPADARAVAALAPATRFARALAEAAP